MIVNVKKTYRKISAKFQNNLFEISLALGIWYVLGVLISIFIIRAAFKKIKSLNYNKKLVNDDDWKNIHMKIPTYMVVLCIIALLSSSTSSAIVSIQALSFSSFGGIFLSDEMYWRTKILNVRRFVS